MPQKDCGGTGRKTERKLTQRYQRQLNVILVDYQIQSLCEQGLLDPYDPEMINPASVDVRIGESAIIETEYGWREHELTQYTKEKPLWVEPKEFLLVATLETFNLPNRVCGEFKLKSSRAREGWNNCLAVWIDPKFVGSKLTMELINECRFTRLPLYPGLRIGQIILHPCNPPLRDYGMTGRYLGDMAVAGSKG